MSPQAGVKAHKESILAMKAFSRQTLVKLILALFWCLPLFIGGRSATVAAETGELDDNFSRLKIHFETQARQNSAPPPLTILGLETTALAWTMAAASLTEDPEARAEWWKRIAELLPPDHNFTEKAESGDLPPVRGLEERHSAALDLYYQAFREITLYLVAATQQKNLALEMKRIHQLTQDKLAGLADQPQRELKKRVILSGALVCVATVTIRSLSGNILTPQLENIVKDLVNRSESLSRCSDLHYRAKLQLLYIGNLRRLTTLIFILGRQAGPSLNRELAELHGNLNLYGPKRSLPGALSLIWAAQAQAAIPVAYWVSRQTPSRPPEPGKARPDQTLRSGSHFFREPM